MLIVWPGLLLEKTSDVNIDIFQAKYSASAIKSPKYQNKIRKSPKIGIKSEKICHVTVVDCLACIIITKD